jgi:hypothetical protein
LNVFAQHEVDAFDGPDKVEMDEEGMAALKIRLRIQNRLEMKQKNEARKKAEEEAAALEAKRRPHWDPVSGVPLNESARKLAGQIDGKVAMNAPAKMYNAPKLTSKYWDAGAKQAHAQRDEHQREVYGKWKAERDAEEEERVLIAKEIARLVAEKKLRDAPRPRFDKKTSLPLNDLARNEVKKLTGMAVFCTIEPKWMKNYNEECWGPIFDPVTGVPCNEAAREEYAEAHRGNPVFIAGHQILAENIAKAEEARRAEHEEAVLYEKNRQIKLATKEHRKRWGPAAELPAKEVEAIMNPPEDPDDKKGAKHK